MALREPTDVLAADEKAFDAAVLRGALDLYNALHSDASAQPGSPARNLGRIVTDALDWLPEALSARAKLAGIDVENVRWLSKESAMDVLDATTVLLYTVGAFGERDAKTLFTLPPVRDGRKRPTPEGWMESILRALPIYTRLVWDGSSIKAVSVPCLTSVQRVVAYAMALLWADKHGFRDRVRACQYLFHPKEGSLAHHYFLADDWRQKFCSPAHQNAQGQRNFRSDPNKARKHK